MLKSREHPIVLDHYPTPIALPLARAAERGGQRKDLLRLAYENLAGLQGDLS